MKNPWIDIGHNVTIEFREIEGICMGIAYTHQTPNGEVHESYIPVGSDPKDWTLIQRTPLTVSPSLLCRECGHHGWIRDGRWIPAL